MAAKKILVVFGATGNQGGSVIKSILGDPKAAEAFSLRGITRDPTAAKAKALAEKGVECVTGDMNDKASLKKAFEGAHSVFAITNYWEKMDDKLELQQGKNVADAAKETNIQHLIFSTLDNVTTLSKGKYSRVYHFDSKAAIESYIRSLSLPASFFMPGYFMSNFETSFNPSPNPPHTPTLAIPWLPETQIPTFDAADDTGKFVKAMVMKREEVLGKNVLGATGYYTPQQVVDAYSKVKGKEAAFFAPSREQFEGTLKGFGMPEFAAVELYENMAFMGEFGYYGGKSLDWSLSLLDEKPTSLEDFFAKSTKLQ